jgi:hypothetical protein
MVLAASAGTGISATATTAAMTRAAAKNRRGDFMVRLLSRVFGVVMFAQITKYMLVSTASL